MQHGMQGAEDIGSVPESMLKGDTQSHSVRFVQTCPDHPRTVNLLAGVVSAHQPSSIGPTPSSLPITSTALQLMRAASSSAIVPKVCCRCYGVKAEANQMLTEKLQSMLIIPRTPTPPPPAVPAVPLKNRDPETLIRDELVQLAKQYKARSMTSTCARVDSLIGSSRRRRKRTKGCSRAARTPSVATGRKFAVVQEVPWLGGSCGRSIVPVHDRTEAK